MYIYIHMLNNYTISIIASAINLIRIIRDKVIYIL